MPRKSLNLSRLETDSVDLTVGIRNFIKGLQHQNPEMSSREIQTLGNAVLDQAGRSLRRGERLASVKLKRDGDFDIDIWHIDRRKDS